MWIRDSSKTYSLGIEALGYSTITIPWSDTYTSLQTGVMDGMTGIPSYMVAQNFGDLAKYYVAMDAFMENNVIVMSQVTAEKLPQEYLTIIEEVCAEMSEKSIPNTETEVNEGIETLKEMGVEILPVSYTHLNAFIFIPLLLSCCQQLYCHFNIDSLFLLCEIL